MNLDRVTITGADDSVKPDDLIRLSQEFPFVEWGVLVSKTQEGSPRFPSRYWVHQLLSALDPGPRIPRRHPVKLSLHVCGRWVRKLMLGESSLFTEWSERADSFQRVQLNFHAQRHPADHDAAVGLMRQALADQQIIVQMDGTVNEALLGEFRVRQLNCVPLYDTSGGAGIVPRYWPVAAPELEYQGYAGGLGPDNLEEELLRIADVTDTARMWIDMERRVRSEDDTQFDLDKVRRVLEICAPVVS